MLLFHLPDEYLWGMGAWVVVGFALLFAILKLRRWRRRRGARPMFLNFAISLWMVLALVTGVELYFALFRDTTDAFNQTNVSRRWFTIHADAQAKTLEFSDTEKLPYRESRPVTPDVGEDRRRFVFLGDSFTFGHGIENIQDRFTNRFEARMNEVGATDCEVANLAWAGTELHWANAVAKKLIADRYVMDTLVYVMCLNDIESFTGEGSPYANIGEHSPDADPFLARYKLTPFFSKTYFLNTLYFRVKQLRTPELRNYYGSIGKEYKGEPWQRMIRVLDEMKAACDRNKTRFVIVVFPFLHNLGEPNNPFEPAHNAIATYGAAARVPVLDLRDALLPHVDDGLTLNSLDAHPNQRAHELAAEALFQFFQTVPDFQASQSDGTVGAEIVK